MAGNIVKCIVISECSSILQDITETGVFVYLILF